MSYTAYKNRSTSHPERFLSHKSRTTLSRGTMVSDVCLVIVWAASIPGLMWLGAAGGF